MHLAEEFLSQTKNPPYEGVVEYGHGHGHCWNGNPDTLFFTAGPDDESHGLFGTITPS